MIRMKSLHLGAAVLVCVFGSVLVSMALGTWKTTSSKVPVKITQGENAGKYNPSDIRGSYTWVDIENAFGISAKDAAEAFSASGFQVNPAERVSALETFYKERLPEGKEVGTDSVRLYVSRLTGLPHEPEEGTVLPAAAVEYLEAKGVADEVARAAKLDSGLLEAAAAAGTAPGASSQTASTPTTVTTSGVKAAPAAAPATKPTAAPAPTAKPATATVPASPAGSTAPVATGTGTPAATETHDTSERKVGGGTTFADLASWGLSTTEIESAIGFKIGASKGSVRDAVQASGGSFSAIKTTLQTLVDAKK